MLEEFRQKGGKSPLQNRESFAAGTSQFREVFAPAVEEGPPTSADIVRCRCSPGQSQLLLLNFHHLPEKANRFGGGRRVPGNLDWSGRIGSDFKLRIHGNPSGASLHRQSIYNKQAPSIKGTEKFFLL